MPILDDERFEAYLKGFRPRAADPLPIHESRHRPRGAFIFWAGTAAAVAILAAVLALHIRKELVRHAERISSPASASPAESQPLTMGSANALMAKSPSFKAMVDEMAFRPQAVPLPEGKVSAVSVLGKEKIKL